MPSTYAHYRLGQEVYKSVSALARTAIKSHKELFDIGLHGPDILFYYRPLAGKSSVRQMRMIKRHCLLIYMDIAAILRWM